MPSKEDAIREFPPPTSKQPLQRFLGMVNFNRQFLPNCAGLMLPLTNMMNCPKGNFELTGEALTAFEKVTVFLANATFLTHPAPEAQMINFVPMAAEKRRVGCPGDESVSGLQLADVPCTTGTGTILSDVSTPFHRHFVPTMMRRAVFHTLHGLSHPGIRA
ncbi:unnamed protein product [Schistocephalus solidus]|uniref:Poly(ADP-ribose) glycohydrolase n=1 Tax=Schistocephalus solidus TaxID=70667 RepID=A0A183SBT3_SCHSO|nr:unnamed protein product [Schistocephalus solidus]